MPKVACTAISKRKCEYAQHGLTTRSTQQRHESVRGHSLDAPKRIWGLVWDMSNEVLFEG